MTAFVLYTAEFFQLKSRRSSLSALALFLYCLSSICTYFPLISPHSRNYIGLSKPLNPTTSIHISFQKNSLPPFISIQPDLQAKVSLYRGQFHPGKASHQWASRLDIYTLSFYSTLEGKLEANLS